MSDTRETVISPGAIDLLKKDRTRYQAAFDTVYGSGASLAALRDGQENPLAKAIEETPGPRRDMTLAGRLWNNTLGAVFYGVQEGINEVIDTGESFDEWYGIKMEEWGIPGYVHVFDKDGTFNPSFKNRSEIIADQETSAFFGQLGVKDDGLEIDVAAAPENMVGQLVAGASQFGIGFFGGSRLIPVSGMLGSFIKGGLADATVFDPSDANIAALAEGFGIPENAVTSLLATDPDDPELINRLRNVAEGAILGGAAEALVYVLRGRKAARAGRKQEAQEYLEEAAARAAKIEKELLAAEAPTILREMQEAVKDTRDFYAELEPIFRLQEDGKLVVEVPEARVRELDGDAIGAPKDPDQLEMDLGDKPPRPTPDMGKRVLTMGEVENIRYYAKLASSAAPEELMARTAISTLRQLERVEDVAPLLAAIAEQFGKAWDMGPGRAKETMAVTAIKGSTKAREIAKQLGVSPAEVRERFKNLDGVTMENLASEVAARSYVVNALMEETNALSEAIAKGTFDKAKYPIYRDMDDLMMDYQYKMSMAAYLADPNDALGSALGRALNARKLQKTNSAALKRIMKDPYFINDARAMARAHQKALVGDGAVLKAVQEVSLARNLIDRLNTYRINALLSGPGTQLVNALSNLLNSVALPTQQIVGGIVTLNRQQIEDGMRTLQGMVLHAYDALESAFKAWELEDAILDPESQKIEGDVLGRDNKVLGIKDGDKSTNMRNAYNIVAGEADKLITLPSRVLLVMDEFFKQSSYRGTVFADANRLAKQANLKGKEKTDFIQGYIQNSFDKTTGRGIREDALLQAQRVTFTEPLAYDSFGGMIQQMAIKVPAARLVVPFIRTPINLLVASFQHIPVLGKWGKRMQEDLAYTADGGRRAAQARGKQAIGLALITLMGAVIDQGNITGSGPSNPQLRNVWLKNNKPYSIRIPQPDGTVKWVSYARLEPYANIIAILADWHEIAADKYEENDIRGLEGAWMAAAAAVMENTVNKTFTQGIFDLMKVTSGQPHEREAALRNFVASFSPNAINQLNGDNLMRESRTLTDALWSRNSNYELVDPKRNILGEVVYRPSPKWDSMSAMHMDIRETDEVLAQIEILGIKNSTMLGLPSRTITDPSDPRGRIDLSQIPYAEGQSLYDKWQQEISEVTIRGKTLRETLEEMFDSYAYKVAPVGFKGSGSGTKMAMVRDKISQYRQAAKNNIPELRDRILLAERAEQAALREQSLQNFSSMFSREDNERELATDGVTLQDLLKYR